jgi:hypothetical protein
MQRGNRPNSSGRSAEITESRSRGQSIARWFDTSTLTPPAPFSFGNVSRTLPDVRGPSLKNADLSLVKNARLRETLMLQVRLESFNLMNRPQFWLPNTNA